MRLELRNRHFFATDIALVAFAAYLSFVLRLEARNLIGYWPGFVLFTGLALLLVPLIFRQGGVYANYWRFASVEELLLLSRSVTAAALISGGLTFLASWSLQGVVGIPRSVPFIFALLALVATAAPRLAVRFVVPNKQHHAVRDAMQPVLVIGAGNAGRMIVRELRQNPDIGMVAVGFLDDDPRKHGMYIHGVPVLGDRSEIPRLAPQHHVEYVIIAMPSTPGKVIREIVNICEQAGVHAKTMPGISELLSGAVSVTQLRNVQIEDLLRRAPVQADFVAVTELIHGKRVLVTGGGGSIGSELCRQVIRCGPAELIVLGHGENSVFEIQNELRRTLHAEGTRSMGGDAPCRLSAVIADIRCAERIRAVFEEYRPDIVFHAAAHKHVPLMELDPEEAVTNNILGTRNLLQAALASDVDRFVMVSSDKAVNPTSIMGATKRAAELLVHQAAKTSGKPYVAVRFGNVLGSRGSVVLTFKQQIAAGGPVTLTHPEMRRYFMTIPEAVTLVLQAAVLGRGGEVFVLDMGEPIKIMDLACDMIELSGLEVGRDIDIVFTGLRPGEKLFEELFVPGERYGRTRHEKIFIAGNASSFVPRGLNEAIHALAIAAQWGDKPAIRRGLQNLIPEYRPGKGVVSEKETPRLDPVESVHPQDTRRQLRQMERPRENESVPAAA